MGALVESAGIAARPQAERFHRYTIADTHAHIIETAMPRVVIACALKHHTRRGAQDPERWQLTSQLVTHALLRNAGFTLPPDTEAWEGVSVEQAYERLPEPPDDNSGGDSDLPSDAGGAAADAAGSPSSGGEDANSDGPADSSGEDDDQTQDRSGHRGESDALPSHDPSGTEEIMDECARGN